MKKIFILTLAFLMLFSFNANAGTFSGANTKNFTPKNEISDVRKAKKINSIQKFIIKKTLKKLQKQVLKPKNIKNKKDGALNLVTGMFILGILFLLGGIAFIIGGGTFIGILFIILGLLLLGTLAFFISLLGNAFSHH